MNYKFCPKCGGKLEIKKIGAGEVPVCLGCGFKFWQNSKPTVSAIILNDQNEVLLAKRSSSFKYGLWGAPGGFLENGEDLVEGLTREVDEEIGVKVEVGDNISYMIELDLRDESGDLYDLNLQYKCQIVSGEPKALHETSEIKWFKKQDIPWDQIAFPGITKALKIIFEINDEL